MNEPPNPAEGGRCLISPRLVVILALAIHLCSAVWHVLTGGMNADEGFYALAARSVWEGEIPYRDFGYTQMPLLPYVNGAVMHLTGFGLFGQRTTNALWAALAISLGAIWLCKRGSASWGLAFVGLLSLSAPWMYFTHLGKTYAFVSMICMAAACIWLHCRSSWQKVAVLALLGTLACGVRLPAAPFFAILWAASLVDIRPIRSGTFLIAVAGSIIWPLLLILPFYLAAPEAARFWTFDFHRLSVPHKPWRVGWQDTFAFAPTMWIALIAVSAWRIRTRCMPHSCETVLAGAALVTISLNLLPTGTFVEYAVPFIPPLLMAVLAMAIPLAAHFPQSRVVWCLFALVAANIVLPPLALHPPAYIAHVSLRSILLPLSAPPYQPDLQQRMTVAHSVVKHFLPIEAPFIGPQIILAAGTGHAVPAQLRLGPFAATADFPAETAATLNLTTFPEITALMANPTIPFLAFAKKSNLNYGWSMPTFRNPPERHAEQWLAMLKRDFSIVYEDADFFLLSRNPALSVTH